MCFTHAMSNALRLGSFNIQFLGYSLDNVCMGQLSLLWLLTHVHLDNPVQSHGMMDCRMHPTLQVLISVIDVILHPSRNRAVISYGMAGIVFSPLCCFVIIVKPHACEPCLLWIWGQAHGAHRLRNWLKISGPGQLDQVWGCIAKYLSCLSYIPSYCDT